VTTYPYAVIQPIYQEGPDLARATIDDTFPDNPKVVGLDLAAVGLWTLLLCHARRYDDRLVTPGLVARYGGSRGKRLMEEMVGRNLFDIADGGWSWHDFEHYGPSDASRERTRRWRERRLGDAPETSPERHGDASLRARAPVPESVVLSPRRERVDKSTRKIEPFADEIAALFEIEKSARAGTGVIHLTDERKKHARSRLAQPYPFDDCADAIRGCLADSWCRDTKNDNMAYALENGGHLEKYRGKWRDRQPAYRHTAPLTDAERGGDFAPISASLKQIGRAN